MRLTNEEILSQFPSWSNHPSGNIQQVRYGDIPDCQYTQESYNYYQQETDPHLLNILLANACIYSQHGAFDIYKTISLLDLALKAGGMYGWTVKEIDSVPKVYKYYDDDLKEQKKTVLLSDEIGTFDIESQDLFSFFTQDMAKYFECVFIFDYRLMTVSAYRPENLGKNTNINIHLRNLQKTNDIDVDDSNIFTRYYVQGDNSLGIEYVNFGHNYLEDISHFLNEKYLSSELIFKYKLWQADVELKRPIYIENTRNYNKQLSIISELYDRVPLDDCKYYCFYVKSR